MLMCTGMPGILEGVPLHAGMMRVTMEGLELCSDLWCWLVVENLRGGWCWCVKSGTILAPLTFARFSGRYATLPWAPMQCHGWCRWAGGVVQGRQRLFLCFYWTHPHCSASLMERRLMIHCSCITNEPHPLRDLFIQKPTKPMRLWSCACPSHTFLLTQ